MTTELYVGNLSSNTTEDELRDLFEPVGQITEIIIILDPDTSLSQGYGYVNFETFAAAQEAIKRLNGHSLDRHKLVVQKSTGIPVPPLLGVSGGSLRNFRHGGRGRI